MLNYWANKNDTCRIMPAVYGYRVEAIVGGRLATTDIFWDEIDAVLQDAEKFKALFWGRIDQAAAAAAAVAGDSGQ